MKSKLRSWRLFILLWSVLLTPQMSLVHALSHAAFYEADGEERERASIQVCDTCLALAQLGSTLPTQQQWTASGDTWQTPISGETPTQILRLALAFQARAPPVALS